MLISCPYIFRGTVVLILFEHAIWYMSGPKAEYGLLSGLEYSFVEGWEGWGRGLAP